MTSPLVGATTGPDDAMLEEDCPPFTLNGATGAIGGRGGGGMADTENAAFPRSVELVLYNEA